MPAVPGFTHLTLEDRIAIQKGIEAGSRKTAIAASLGKDKSTISKEIKAHRFALRTAALPLQCRHYPNCPYKHKCSENCRGYVLFSCTRRDRSPGACNGCEGRSKCPFDQFEYSAVRAQAEYDRLLIQSRTGANLKPERARRLAEIIGPLLREGTSPATICSMHPELGLSVSTLYHYLHGGVLTPYDPGLKVFERHASH